MPTALNIILEVQILMSYAAVSLQTLINKSSFYETALNFHGLCIYEDDFSSECHFRSTCWFMKL